MHRSEEILFVGSLRGEYLGGDAIVGVVLSSEFLDVVDAEEVVDEVEDLFAACLLQVSVHFVVFTQTDLQQAALGDCAGVFAVVLRLGAVFQAFDVGPLPFEQLFFSKRFSCLCVDLSGFIFMGEEDLAVDDDVDFVDGVALVVDVFGCFEVDEFSDAEEDAASELVEFSEEGVGVFDEFVGGDVELEWQFFLFPFFFVGFDFAAFDLFQDNVLTVEFSDSLLIFG